MCLLPARRAGAGSMERGGWPWLLYAAVTSSLGPLLVPPLLLLRRMRGLELARHWPERLGHASLARPAGHLLWFHAVSVGEGMAAIPVIKHCIQARPAVNILMTTSTVAAFSFLEQTLPPGVLCQFAPFDTPYAVRRFLVHWQPQAAIFMESELWPNLIMATADNGVTLALLNARISSRSFRRWSATPGRNLVTAMLSKFSLIAPVNAKEAEHFQVLGASPAVLHVAGNLKYACGRTEFRQPDTLNSEVISKAEGRRIWLAASTHDGEEDVALRIHTCLRRSIPDVLTVIAPRHPERARGFVLKLKKQGIGVAQRSIEDEITDSTEVYVVDTVGELGLMYSLAPIAFVGGSLFEGLRGHNFAEAAAAGCAILTGPHLGHFTEMLHEMQKVEPSSVQQVDGELALQAAVENLFHDESTLSARREAARRASAACAAEVVSRVWGVLDTLVLTKSFD